MNIVYNKPAPNSPGPLKKVEKPSTTELKLAL